LIITPSKLIYEFPLINKLIDIMSFKNFDWNFYCNYHKDLMENGINTEKKARDHYINFGRHENRLICSPSQLQSHLSSVHTPNANDKIRNDNSLWPCQRDIPSSYIKDEMCVLMIGYPSIAHIEWIICKNDNTTYYNVYKNSCLRNMTDKLTNKSYFSRCYFDKYEIVNDTKDEHGAIVPRIVFPHVNEKFNIVIYNDKVSDLSQYLSEIYRVLRNGDKCLIICNFATNVSETEVIKLAKLFNFKIVEIIYGSRDNISDNEPFNDIFVITK